MKRNPVLAVMSTLAALQLLLASSAAGDVISKKTLALLLAMVGAVQLGIQFYVRGQVTPWDTVVAQRVDGGAIVAGPSAQAPTGVEVEEPIPT